MSYLTLARDERTIKRAMEIVGKSKNLGDRWSRKWSWIVRAAAYEEHYMLLRLESVEARRDNMFVRQEGMAETALSIVEAHFNDLLEQIDEAQKAGQVKPDALVRLFDTAAKIHRMAVKGRLDAHESSTKAREALAEAYADEMALFLKDLFNELQLSPTQSRLAREKMTGFFSKKKHA
jgi:hypothetical protein